MDYKRKWYLPIFSARNPNKPKKTRLAWDAAAVYKGFSLNGCLEKGPDLLRPLTNIIYNFRIVKIGICADIYEMFHRVSVNEEDHHAQRFLWRDCDDSGAPDADAYHHDIINLQKDPRCILPNSSSLRKLSPFLEDDEIVRLRSRLERAPIEDAAKKPVILPKTHKITQLIIDWYHRKYQHVHHDMVLNEIFQRFYIPSLRRTLRSVRLNCMSCKLRNANPHPTEMGPLPVGRLAPYTRPFTYLGIDFFGPVFVTIGRRTEKRYGVLFTCMTCHAIHIEVAHSLSMNSCVMVIRNFISRRGQPIEIFSDNGTNLVAAEKELRKAYAELNFDALQAKLTTAECKWTFIPPESPHMGGAWERLIRSVKNVMYHIVTPDTKLTDEKLHNLLLEVESIVNGRPLTYLSLDAADQEALTPNHFLLGSSSGSKPPSKFCSTDKYVKGSWRHSQYLADMFWKRWVAEVLPTLTRRSKWFDHTQPIEKDDVVIIIDPNLPRHAWPKGIVTNVYTSKEGQNESRPTDLLPAVKPLMAIGYE
ncbi:uncharacterized protein LOC118754303 [Rhagoletis pomonella]|uniref:uncharacterized protein LOC118754303 n=1 Tax=Rhagoletis pomonella TaxID=28610 RepID=UPI001783A2BA|nr:uncharacterized protein LOC118754303 [Rhagoletis pomonella]